MSATGHAIEGKFEWISRSPRVTAGELPLKGVGLWLMWKRWKDSFWGAGSVAVQWDLLERERTPTLPGFK